MTHLVTLLKRQIVFLSHSFSLSQLCSELDGTFLCVQQMAPFSMYSSYSFFHPFHSVRPQEEVCMDASQYKAELTIGRLVSKQPLSRVWHCSETMFLNDSIAHCVVHSTVPAVSCSVIRHPLFQCLSIS